MRNPLPTTCAVVVLLLPFSHGAAQGKADGLLAKPYPGSVVDPSKQLWGAPSRAVVEARASGFFSKDPVEKVKAFYTGLGEFYTSPEGDHIQVCDVVPFSEVVKIVGKKGGEVGEGGNNFWGGTRAGVTLYGRPLNAHYSVTKVFESLQKAYLQRFIDPDNFDMEVTTKHLDDPELKAVEAKYEHCKWAYYMDSNHKRTDALSGTLSMDEVIFDKYYTAPAEARAKELAEVQKKLTDAITAMKYNEATALGERMMKLSGAQPDHQEDWNMAIKCLDELSTHAYQTKIVIDTHPSKWIIVPPQW